MFEYSPNSHKLKTRIGKYVSGYIVQKEPFKQGHMPVLRSTEELNGLNRLHLAATFMKTKEGNYFLKDLEDSCYYDHNQLLDDVARFIDHRIPKAYVKWSDFPNESEEWSIDGTGLIYHFSENYLLESDMQAKKKEFITQSMGQMFATKEQIQYLKSLLANGGYKLKIEVDDLDMAQAKKFISFFVKDVQLPSELFKLLEYDI